MWRLITLVAVLVVSLLGRSMAVAQDETTLIKPDPRMPHLAHIHKGQCGRLVPSPIATLADVMASEDESAALPVLVSQPQSEHTVYLTLDALREGGYAVAVHYPEEIIGEHGLGLAGSYVACGEIEGPLLADGSLVIPLQEQNSSGYVGIAQLQSNPDAADSLLLTLVTIYLIPPASAVSPSGTPVTR